MKLKLRPPGPPPRTAADQLRLSKKLLAASIVLSRRTAAPVADPEPAAPPPRDEELVRATADVASKQQALDAGITSRFDAIRRAAVEHAKSVGGQVAQLSQHGIQARAAAQAAAGSAKAVSEKVDAALEQARRVGNDAVTLAAGAKDVAGHALAETGKVPSLLGALQQALSQAIGEVADMARLALERIAKLGVVVVALEQRGYVLWARFSDGSEKSVGRMAYVVQDFGGGGGGSVTVNNGDGGVEIHVENISANFVVTSESQRWLILADASFAPITVTLPPASGRTPALDITVKRTNVSGFAVTVVPQAGELIDGSGLGISMNAARIGNTTGLEFTPASGNWWIT